MTIRRIITIAAVTGVLGLFATAPAAAHDQPGSYNSNTGRTDYDCPEGTKVYYRWGYIPEHRIRNAGPTYEQKTVEYNGDGSMERHTRWERMRHDAYEGNDGQRDLWHYEHSMDVPCAVSRWMPRRYSA